MTKFSFVLLAVLLSLFMFVIGFKIGDSHGFDDGYKAGYVYDCRDEVMQLREAHEDLKKAVDFSKKKAEEVQFENARLKYSREHYEDSLKNVERVKFLEDSIAKSADPSGLTVNRYTGKVERDILRFLRDNDVKK